MAFLMEVPVLFRLVRKEDLPALEWMGLHTPERDIIAGVFDAQEQGEALMLVADANGYPIGQVWLDFLRRGTEACPRLWAIRVFPPLQRAGLGRRMIMEAEALAADRGAREVELGVEWDNVAAYRLYRRLGYVAADEERDELTGWANGSFRTRAIHQRIMRKHLRPRQSEVREIPSIRPNREKHTRRDSSE